MRSQLTALGLATAFSLSLPLGSQAQSNKSLTPVQTEFAQAGLVLKVLDTNGAAIRGASVSIVNDATGKVTLAKTNEVGELSVSDLPFGSYRIVISATGFTTLVQLHAALPTRETITLELWNISGPASWEVPLESAVIPSQLSEPPSPVILKLPNPAEHRNILRRFFSKLREIL